jgi:hypothetical protein
MACGESEWLFDTCTSERVGFVWEANHLGLDELREFAAMAAGSGDGLFAVLKVPAFDVRRGLLRILAGCCDREGVDPAKVTVEVTNPYSGPETDWFLGSLPRSPFTFAVDVWRAPVELVYSLPVSAWLVDMQLAEQSAGLGVKWDKYLAYLVEQANSRGVTELYAMNVETKADHDAVVHCGIGVMGGSFAVTRCESLR